MGKKQKCRCCGAKIVTMAYKGTGYCGQLCQQGRCEHVTGIKPVITGERCHFGCGS